MSITINKYIGKTIRKATLFEDALYLYFNEHSGLKISDEGQSCCEHRYMDTDDDLNWLAGKVFRNITLKYADEATDREDSVHELAFLEVMTDDGCITLVNHNEHNGYYDGFSINTEEF